MKKTLLLITSIFILTVTKHSLCFAQDQSAIDSLSKAISIMPADSNKVQALSKLGRAYLYTHPDSSMRLCREQLELSTELSYTKGIGDALIGISNNYYIRGEYAAAVENYLETLRVFRSIDNKLGMASAAMGVGLIKARQGEQEGALKYFGEARELYDQMNAKSSMASVDINIAGIYVALKDHERALDSYQKALEACNEAGNRRGAADSYMGIGIVQNRLGDHDASLKSYETALALIEELGDKRSKSKVLINIGAMYSKKGDIAAAISQTHMGVKLAEELGNLNGMKDGYHILSQAFAKSEKFKEAYDYYKRFATAKDSIFNEDKSKQIGKLEAKHEFETAETERKRLEQEQAKLEALAKSRRDNLQYSGILIFMVLVFAGVFMLGRFSIPIRLAEGMIFFSFLLFFEFTLVLLDPYIEQYSSGAPAIKLGFNAVLAGLIFPLHSIFETKLKQNIIAKQ